MSLTYNVSFLYRSVSPLSSTGAAASSTVTIITTPPTHIEGKKPIRKRNASSLMSRQV